MLPVKPFFETIYRLRAEEEILLFGKALAIDPDDEADVADLLRAEWDNEQLEYPGTPPPFHTGAALWAAKTLYIAAQLLLYREHPADELHTLLPPAGMEIDAGAMLSADLCLRMLPAILRNLKAIDPEDPLIALLESHLQQWHYAAVGYGLPPEALDFAPVSGNACALQLYADRVVARKDRQLAQHKALAPTIKASMGDYSRYFWKE